MPYVPQEMPSAAPLDSLEFKEWLTTVQQFYLNEAGFLNLDTMPQDYPNTTEYYAKLSDTFMYFNDVNITALYIYLPKAQEVLGKKYYVFTNPSGAATSASFIMRVAKDHGAVTGNGWVTIAPAPSLNQKWEILATEQGWLAVDL